MMGKRGQSSMEFTVLIGVMFFIFLVFFYVTGSRFAEIRTDNDRLLLEDFGDYVKTEITLAATASDGYSRSFYIPPTLGGRNYKIEINEYTGTTLNFSEMLVSFVDYSLEYTYEARLPISVSGDIMQTEGATVTVVKHDNRIDVIQVIEDTACINECEQLGSTRCLSGTVRQTCIRDADDEGCYVWGEDMVCYHGLCDDGLGECCIHECEQLETTYCSSPTYSKICENNDADICYEWSAISSPCPDQVCYTPTCSNNQCGLTEVGEGVTDTNCIENIGCSGGTGTCVCDGEGNCVKSSKLM